MSIWLHPRNKALERFDIGTGCWGYLLEHAGLVWPLMFNGARWWAVSGTDPRMPTVEAGDVFYPDILGDSGRQFRVTADEARILARTARNMVTIQEMLPESHAKANDSHLPDYQRVWPVKVRDDWPPVWAAFAEWAEKSRGFTKGG